MKAAPALGLTAVNHRYSWNDGTTVVGPMPSVTGIQRLQDSLGGSDGLVKWAAGLAVDAFASSNDKAAALAATDEPARIGNIVHDQVRCILTGRPIEPDHDSVWHLAHFAAFLGAERPEVLFAEEMVANVTLGYAGQFDFIARIRDQIAIVDVKTGKAKTSHRLQLAGYSLAEFIGREGSTERIPVPAIEAGYILLLRTDGYELVEQTPTEEDRDQFRFLVATHKRINAWPPKASKPVIQPALFEGAA